MRKGEGPTISVVLGGGWSYIGVFAQCPFNVYVMLWLMSRVLKSFIIVLKMSYCILIDEDLTTVSSYCVFNIHLNKLYTWLTIHLMANIYSKDWKLLTFYSSTSSSSSNANDSLLAVALFFDEDFLDELGWTSVSFFSIFSLSLVFALKITRSVRSARLVASSAN